MSHAFNLLLVIGFHVMAWGALVCVFLWVVASFSEGRRK